MVQSQAIWQKTKSGSKSGFDKLWGWADKLGAPVNRLSNKLGSEAFWPTTLDKECDKAARILRSFCSMLPSFLYFYPTLTQLQRMAFTKRKSRRQLTDLNKSKGCLK